MASCSSDPELCQLCEISYFKSIMMDEKDVPTFFIDHGINKNDTKCPTCGRVCMLNTFPFQFRCQKITCEDKKKQTKCNFELSTRCGTFLDSSHLDHLTIFRYFIHSAHRLLPARITTFIPIFQIISELNCCVTQQSLPLVISKL